MNFLHNYLPDNIFLDFGAVKIYYYGMFFAVVFVICYFLLQLLAKKNNLLNTHLLNLIFYLIIFGLIGARLYYVIFYNFKYYWAAPLEILKIWQGGLAITGAIISGFLVLIIYCRKFKLNLWLYSDLIAAILPLAQAIGRWGNYFNQELYGWPTNLPWGIPISFENRLAGYEAFQYFQPVFLYESLLDLVLFFILFIIYRRRIKFGYLTLFYLAGYCLIRFFMEFIRIDPAPLFYGMRLPQIVAFSGFIIFSWLILKKFKKSKSN